MPTARELLEQADALMRRNRAAAAAAEAATNAPRPIAAPGPGPGAMVSPRTIQREPIAPSLARTSLPVDPTESPLVVAAEPRARFAAEQERDAAGEVPLLTEAVVDDGDDVPVLTDAVEEIDVTEVRGGDEPLVADTARGELSVWLDADEGDASLLGPAPDSVVVVPEPELVPAPVLPPQLPPAGRDPLGLDQPAPGFDAYESEEAAESERGPIEEPESPPSPDVSDEERGSEPRDDVRAVELAAGTPESAEQTAIAATTAAAVSGAAVVARSDADEARIREIAEEIGMQVLQRIDIFTDTSLRERLGERLKPVVERVSADLVDALNQHVGELLREYVAEAIEREIETWRTKDGGK